MTIAQSQIIEYETIQKSRPEPTHTCLTATSLAYARKKGHLDAAKIYAERCPTGACQMVLTNFLAKRKNAVN